MRATRAMLVSLLLISTTTFAQQIYDIYTTAWDRSSMFAYQNLGSNPINFASPGTDGQATITIADSTVYQPIDGFGATLTDTAASSLAGLKNANSDTYWDLLRIMFDASDHNRNAGLSFMRVALAASDMSSAAYTYDDNSGDTSLSSFSLDQASDAFLVLKDILSINSAIKLHLVPWSPPGWMKDTQTMKGGSIVAKFYSAYATYLFKAVTGFRDALGAEPYSIAIQNEPQNSDSTYPTCTMSVDDMGHIGTALRQMLDDNGLSSVKVIGYEHNWNDAATYPVQLMQKYGDAFAGVAFHCYQGSFEQQASFTSAVPEKAVYHTECSGTMGSDWWSDIKWYMDNLFIGSVEFGSSSAMMWNLAGPSDGSGLLPGTDSCGGGCRPVVGIDGGSFTLNQEFYAMAQAQKAVLPVDEGGSVGQRVQVSVSGEQNWALRVGAYVTARVDGAYNRYSLVVLNWDDAANGEWKSQDVETTINFRGMQARYKFPVGVTTLYWFATSNGHPRRNRNGTRDNGIRVSHAGRALPPTRFARVRKETTELALPKQQNLTVGSNSVEHPSKMRHARKRLSHHHP